jgi:uncharacterized protein RhaS with RHS repeats
MICCSPVVLSTEQNSFVSLNQLNYSLFYDENGNLLQDEKFKYYYDGFNQLSKVTTLNDELVSLYGYDHEGKRVVKRSNSSTTHYVDMSFVQEHNSSGVFNESYYHDGRVLIDGISLFSSKSLLFRRFLLWNV